MSNKNERVILQVKYPIITSYTSDAHMLSILSNYPSTLEWVFNNYVSLWGELYKDEALLRFSSWDIRKACPYFKLNYFDKKSCEGNIIEFLISEIDSGHYITLGYDQYYIPNCLHFMKTHFEHEMLIYGYDKKLELFHIAEFWNSTYGFDVVSFKSVEEAIKTVDPNKFLKSSCIIEYINADYKFNVYFLINSLNNFLYSKNTIAINENVYIAEDEWYQIRRGQYTFGIQNYNLLKRTLLRILNDKIEFDDIRPFHVIFDHKVMMCERLKYLVCKGLIHSDDPIIDVYANIKYISLLNRSLYIKFYVTKNYKLIDQIIRNIDIIESKEIDAINHLIECLSTKL
jgi:hypothetical protein